MKRVLLFFLFGLVMTRPVISVEKIVKARELKKQSNTGFGPPRTYYSLVHETTYLSPETLSDQDVFYVYRVEEIDGKLAGLQTTSQSQLNEKTKGLQDQINANFAKQDIGLKSLKTDVQALDVKFQTSIEELPSLVATETIPVIKETLENDAEFQKVVSNKVMDQLFEHIEALNERIRKLEQSRS